MGGNYKYWKIEEMYEGGSVKGKEIVNNFGGN